MNKQQTGKTGEDIVVKYLRRKGYRILERNWRYRRYEIDLIAMLKNTLVFVEVKTRRTDKYGYPEESVSDRKAQSMHKAAVAYLEKRNDSPPIRFDIVSVYLRYGLITINHFEDAV